MIKVVRPALKCMCDKWLFKFQHLSLFQNVLTYSYNESFLSPCSLKKENWNIKWSSIKLKPKRNSEVWIQLSREDLFIHHQCLAGPCYISTCLHTRTHLILLLPVWLRRLVYNRIITMARVHQNSPNKQHRMASECFCQQRRHHGPMDTNDMSVCESSSSRSVLATEYAICERGSLARLFSGIRQCLTSNMKF